MANRLENLLARVEKQDPALAKDLREQIKELSSRRSFGLNFEQHVPETVELLRAQAPTRRQSAVPRTSR